MATYEKQPTKGQPDHIIFVRWDILGVIHLGGCSDVTGKKPVSSSEESKGSTLYVVNAGDRSLLAFDPPQNEASNPLSVLPQGNVSPSRRFPESVTGPAGLFLDRESDTLYVANAGQNAILIYENASALKPDRKIAGGATLLSFTGDGADITGALLVDTSRGKERIFVGQPKDLTCPAACSEVRGAFLIFSVEGNVAPGRIWSGGGAPLAGPSAIALDEDVLYLANQGNPGITADDSISIFTTASQVQGDTIPPQSVTNRLNNPAGLALDSARCRLSVSNSGTDCTDPATPCNSISVFNTDDFGSAQPTISSSALDAPRGLALDVGRKILYVANSGAQSVLMFKNVETLNGEVEPDIELTGFRNPIAVAVDSNRDLLYVLDEETKEIVVIEAASSENETVTERVITGDFMTTPFSLFLDPQNDLLYVADQGANRVYIFTGASSAEGAANHTTLSGDNTGLNQPVPSP